MKALVRPFVSFCIICLSYLMLLFWKVTISSLFLRIIFDLRPWVPIFNSSISTVAQRHKHIKDKKMMVLAPWNGRWGRVWPHMWPDCGNSAFYAEGSILKSAKRRVQPLTLQNIDIFDCADLCTSRTIHLHIQLHLSIKSRKRNIFTITTTFLIHKLRLWKHMSIIWMEERGVLLILHGIDSLFLLFHFVSNRSRKILTDLE